MYHQPRKIAAVALILIIGVLCNLLSIRYITGTLDPFYIIASDSIVPTLNVGDLIFIQQHSGNDTATSSASSTNAASFENLKVGDVILLKNPYFVNDKGETLALVHRVTQNYTSSQGERVVRTKGDHNPASIPKLDYPIFKKYYVGKVMYAIPKIGLIARLLFASPINYIFVAPPFCCSICYHDNHIYSKEERAKKPRTGIK